MIVIAEEQQQGWTAIGSGFINRSITSMGFKMVEHTLQRTSFCSTSKIIENFPIVKTATIKRYVDGLVFEFTIKFEPKTFESQNLEQSFVNKIIDINKNSTKSLATSFNPTTKEIICTSQKTDINHNMHPEILPDILKQFKKIENLLIQCREKQNPNKDQKNISCMRAWIENQREKRFKSSKINDQYFNDSERVNQFAHRYKEAKNKCLSKLKKKQNESPLIYRFIKLFKTEIDETDCRLNPYPHIQLLMSQYKIYNLGSVNKKTHEQLQQKVEQIKLKEKQYLMQKTLNPGIEQKVNEQQENVVWARSRLIAKKKLHSFDNSFNSQIKMLQFIRNFRCSAINNFFTSESIKEKFTKNKYDNLTLYSQYYQNDLNTKILKKKNALIILQTLVEGMVFMKNKKLLHRDLKPDNILLTDRYYPKIIDFGSAYFSNQYRGSRAGFIEKLKTSIHYNLFYSEMHESIKVLYNRYEFQTSPYFDIYALGKIITLLFSPKQTTQQLGEFFYQSIEWLASTCTQKNPQDRPDPLDIFIYVRLLIILIARK